MLNKIRAVMFGHAVGDALGVPVEFKDRSILEQHPVTGMVGFGTYHLPAGCWSDDTSMSLCALESLAKGTLDYDDIMSNFGTWYYNEDFTANGHVFDIGGTCLAAIHNYIDSGLPVNKCGIKHQKYNGNGSLMRIHPFVLYAFYNGVNNDDFTKMIIDASSLTHAHFISTDGCIIYSYVLRALLENPSKDSIYRALNAACIDDIYYPPNKYYKRLLCQDISTVDRNEIKSSGYVVDSLEAAIWCLLTTDSYDECVLEAVNLGGDTDTIAAIAGGLAGALYGFDAINKSWLDTLKKKDYIDDMCKRAYERWHTNNM
jgi:ADP-ribosylglycohydrolase